MLNIEGTTLKRTHPDRVWLLRLILLGACLLLFSVGYTAQIILFLPLPAPKNTSTLFLSLVRTEFFSYQTLILLAVAIQFGRHFDDPPSSRGEFLKFPGWLVKQPFAGIFLGLAIFISPLLIAIGLSGIVYVLSAAFVLYSTPRLLARGFIGAVILMLSWTSAGFFLATLLLTTPDVATCNADASLALRSGVSIPCEDFVYLENVGGFVLRHGHSATYVLSSDLASSAIGILGNGPWLIRDIGPLR